MKAPATQFLHLIILLLPFITSAFSQDKKERPSQDHTIPFVEIYRNIDKYYNPEELSEYEVYFVRGYLTDLWKNIPGTGFLQETLQWAGQEGINLKTIDINAEGTLEENARIILEAIKGKSSNKKVILVGHSKGGVDVLHAIQKMSPEEIKKNVAGVLSLQAPYWGTPVADWILKNRYLSPLVDFALRKWGGSDLSSLKDISVEERKKYHEENSKKLEELIQATGLPVISLATYLEPSFPDKTLLFTRKWLIGEEPNDGLVTCNGAKFPFGDLVELEGTDHAAPVMRGIQEVDREVFMKSLLTLLVKKIKDGDSWGKLHENWEARGQKAPSIPYQYPLLRLARQGANIALLLLFSSLLPRGMVP